MTKERFDQHQPRIMFTRSDLGSPHLGIEDEVLQKILLTDNFIYNSWKPDFALPLSTYEEPFLVGFHTIIDWSRLSTTGLS
ncbi:hypothetical protein N0V90_006864 [Kalmusia sp. IMI 367209]|nr:hypothetical protein N0V90_006864 [Kalmusia sp. IMI 367209]